MLQARNWFFLVFGEKAATICFVFVFAILFFWIFLFARPRPRSLPRCGLILLIFLLAYFFSRWQPYFAEKVHVLYYGLLGFSAANDIFPAGKKTSFLYLFLPLLFICLISALDECFQWLLPYRVAELRDFYTNLISAVFGMGVFFVLNPGGNRNSSPRSAK